MTKHWPDDEPKVLLEVCTCGTEGLRISSVNWEPWQEVWLAFWQLGHHENAKKPSWRNRLRQILKIVRTGIPYEDMVCLDINQARRVAEVILEHVNAIERHDDES